VRPRGRRVLRRKTRRALVLRRQDWIVIAILCLALIGSIFIWVLFFAAWSPKSTRTPRSHNTTPDHMSASQAHSSTQALSRLPVASRQRTG